MIAAITAMATAGVSALSHSDDHDQGRCHNDRDGLHPRMTMADQNALARRGAGLLNGFTLISLLGAVIAVVWSLTAVVAALSHDDCVTVVTRTGGGVTTTRTCS